jgi:hypothetical protein
MGPAERRSLEAALVKLNTQQSDAIQDGTYLGWTPDPSYRLKIGGGESRNCAVIWGEQSRSDLIQHY